MDFIRFSLDVSEPPIAPPSHTGEITALKEFTATAQYAPTGQQSGTALLYHPGDGCQSLSLWRTISDGMLNTTIIYVGDATVTQVPYTLTFKANQYLPLVPEVNVSIAPTPANYGGQQEVLLGETETLRGRIVASSIRVQSDSTSTTSTAISGTITAAIVTDSRFLAQQNLTSPYGPTALRFDAASLIQNAVNKSKDALLNIPVQDGVTALLGADVPPKLVPMKRNFTATSLEGADVSYPLETTDAGLLNPPLNSNPVNLFGYDVGFFSPYCTAVAGTMITPPPLMPTDVHVSNFTVARIPLNETPCFDVTIQCAPSPSAGMPDTPRQTLRAVHVYACVGVDGKPSYYVQNEMVCISESFFASGLTLYPATWTVQLRPKRPTDTDGVSSPGTTGSAVTALWIGTFMSVLSRTQLVKTAITNVTMYTLGAHRLGTCGPATIWKIDTLASGQTINVSGKLWVEYVPGSRVVPYVTAPFQSTDVGALEVIRALNHSTAPMFRRMWTVPQYEAMIGELDEMLSSRSLLHIPCVANNKRLHSKISSLLKASE